MISVCYAGYFHKSEACSECPQGFWSSPARGSDVKKCFQCTGGQVTRNTKQTSSDKCRMLILMFSRNLYLAFSCLFY